MIDPSRNGGRWQSKLEISSHNSGGTSPDDMAHFDVTDKQGRRGQAWADTLMVNGG